MALAHHTFSRPARCAAFCVLAVGLVASDAFAQASVRVTVERANVWRPGFFPIDTIVTDGTELEVSSRQGDWYEVVLPASEGLPRRTGFIAVAQVAVVSGTAPVQAPVRPPPPRERVGIRLFGQVGYGWFEAREAFDNVFGEHAGRWLGGGLEVRERKAFLFVSGERFRRTGERVFVFDDQVFPLGIPNTLTLTPVTVVLGYRHDLWRLAPYVGGGVGRYWIKEEAPFAEGEENATEQTTSYVFVGGAEWPVVRTVAAAVEVQYTHIPREFSEGVAAAFGEQSLGGMQVRVKVLFGR